MGWFKHSENIETEYGRNWKLGAQQAAADRESEACTGRPASCVSTPDNKVTWPGAWEEGYEDGGGAGWW